MLITEGQVELLRKAKAEPEMDKIKLSHMVVGVVEEGEFIGDCELALELPFRFRAVCKSEKVKAYICD